MVEVMTRIAVGILLVTLIWSAIDFPATAANDLESQTKALNIIRDFANEICGSVKAEGASSNIELSGDARAKLGGALAKVADLGIEGAAKYRSEEYKNVLQKDLAATIHQSTNCKLDVFKLLNEKMVLSAKATPTEGAENIFIRMKSSSAAERLAAITDIAAANNPDLVEAAIEEGIKSPYVDVRCWSIRTKFARVQNFRVELFAGDSTARSIADAQANNSSAYAFIPKIVYDRKMGRFQSTNGPSYSGNVGCDSISFNNDSICMGTLRNKIGTWDFQGRVSCRYYQGTSPFIGTFVLD